MDDTQAAGPQGKVEVTLGGRTVRVPAGGPFDRYQMRTDLDEVAKNPRVAGVGFFRDQPKVEVRSRIGPTLTPNFSYAMSNARLTMIAPVRAVRRRLPRELEPLRIAPGCGLVSVLLFRYDVCGIDFSTEAAVGIAVKPARHGPIGAVRPAGGAEERPPRLLRPPRHRGPEDPQAASGHQVDKQQTSRQADTKE